MTPHRTISHVGAGGRIRTIDANFDLGIGRWRVRQEYGPARAIWDAAYGYVSGFRKRDIAYYLLTRSLSARIWRIAHRWEKRHVDQDTCGHGMRMPIGKRVICAHCSRDCGAMPRRPHTRPVPREWNQR